MCVLTSSTDAGISIESLSAVAAVRCPSHADRAPEVIGREYSVPEGAIVILLISSTAVLNTALTAITAKAAAIFFRMNASGIA